MKKQKKKKILKPIDIDAHFKYRCPKCSIDHWISLNEAKTKNFKVVCDCSKVFSPKRIAKLKICYESVAKTTIKATIKQEEQPSLDNDILKQCVSVLSSYGFTEDESSDLIRKAHNINPSADATTLIKLALKSFGDSQI